MTKSSLLHNRNIQKAPVVNLKYKKKTKEGNKNKYYI